MTSRRFLGVVAPARLFLLAAVICLRPTVVATGGDDDLQNAKGKQKSQAEADKEAGGAAEQKSPKKDAESGPGPQDDRLVGLVVDGDDKPVAGVDVTLDRYVSEPEFAAKSDADGRFELRVPQDKRKYRTLSARKDKGKLVGTFRIPGEEFESKTLELKIKLGPARELAMRVVDGTGQPVVDAMVGVIAGYRDADASATDAQGMATLLIPATEDIQEVYAVKSGVGLDYRSFVVPRESRRDRRAKAPEFPKEGVTLTLDGVRPLQVTLSTTDDQPIRNAKAYVWLLRKPGEAEDLNLSFVAQRAPFLRHADDQGRVTFDWVPRWQEQLLQIWPQAEEFTHERGMYDPQSGTGEVTLRLNRLVPIRGKVLTPDGGPAPGVVIDIAGAGYNFDDFRQAIKSRDDGTFEVLAAPNKVYLLIVKDTKWAAAPVTGFALLPDQPVEGLEFRLRPTTRIHGRVTQGPDDEPVSGLGITSYQFGADAHNLKGVALPNPASENRWVQPMLFHHAKTDADGHFEYFVGPGHFDIRGPNQNKIEKFEIQNEAEKEFNFHMPRAEKGILKGLVVAGEPRKPVVGAKVHAIERWHFGDDLQAVTDDQGRFELERNLHPATVCVTNADGSLGGVIEIDSDAKVMFLALKPIANVTGILIDDATKVPVADQEIVFGMQVHLGDKTAPWRTAFGGTVRTDAEGKFELKRLVQGGTYRVNRTVVAGQRWTEVTTVTPEKPGEIDLGTVVVKP